MIEVFINPGSGPVKVPKYGPRLSSAIKNIKQFIKDCGVSGVKYIRLKELDGDGRFGFLLFKGTRCHKVEMPGLPIDQVRFINAEDQNIWDFPRLYIDGSSWAWNFGILNKYSWR
ncbi:MAG: hypothetical protein AB7O96_00975 [Pseudobdellovibrionaceae bacterium]